jgi:hypothetical protein
VTQTKDIIRQLKKVAAEYGYRLENHHQAVADCRSLCMDNPKIIRLWN